MRLLVDREREIRVITDGSPESVCEGERVLLPSTRQAEIITGIDFSSDWYYVCLVPLFQLYMPHATQEGNWWVTPVAKNKQHTLDGHGVIFA